MTKGHEIYMKASLMRRFPFSFFCVFLKHAWAEHSVSNITLTIIGLGYMGISYIK